MDGQTELNFIRCLQKKRGGHTHGQTGIFFYYYFRYLLELEGAIRPSFLPAIILFSASDFMIGFIGLIELIGLIWLIGLIG